MRNWLFCICNASKKYPKLVESSRVNLYHLCCISVIKGRHMNNLDSFTSSQVFLKLLMEAEP